MGERLFKRGRIWYAWVPQPEGGLIKVSTRQTDRRAAEVKLRQLERRALDPTHAAAHKATVQRIVDDYFRSRQRLGRRPGTMHHYATKLGNVLRLGPQFGRDVTHERLLQYIDDRMAEGVQRTTIKKELRALKAALRLARRNGIFTADPTDVIPELEDSYKPRTRALTQWELVGLCCALAPARAARVAWIVATGARWGESDRARWGDRAGMFQALRGTKTDLAERTVPIVGLSTGLLLWAEARALPAFAGEPLFESWQNVRRDLVVACAKIGIVPVSPNDLRRTFATWLRAGGVSPDLIGVAMGHADSRMVEQVYGRLPPEELGRLLMERTSGMNVGGTHAMARPETAVVTLPEQRLLPQNAVPRPGVEPGTRGFSVRRVSRGSSTESKILRDAGLNVGSRMRPPDIPVDTREDAAAVESEDES